MVVEISHLEVVLMMDCGGVHCSGGCARYRETFYSEALRLIELATYSQRGNLALVGCKAGTRHVPE
jgi:hypothetical protein